MSYRDMTKREFEKELKKMGFSMKKEFWFADVTGQISARVSLGGLLNEDMKTLDRRATLCKLASDRRWHRLQNEKLNRMEAEDAKFWSEV